MHFTYVASYITFKVKFNFCLFHALSIFKNVFHFYCIDFFLNDCFFISFFCEYIFFAFVSLKYLEISNFFFFYLVLNFWVINLCWNQEIIYMDSEFWNKRITKKLIFLQFYFLKFSNFPPFFQRKTALKKNPLATNWFPLVGLFIFC